MSKPIIHLPEGFHVYGSSTIGYLDGNDGIHLNVEAPVIQIPSADKKAVLAAMRECVPGTIAYLPAWKGAWQYKADGTWEEMISGA